MPDAVYENDKCLKETEGILDYQAVDDGVKIEVGSGEYTLGIRCKSLVFCLNDV